VSALRVRGVSLTVVTLAAAVAIANFGFSNTTWGVGPNGSPVPDHYWYRISKAGLNSARAQLLLSRKRAELEDFINRGQRCQHRSNGTTATRTTRHG